MMEAIGMGRIGAALLGLGGLVVLAAGEAPASSREPAEWRPWLLAAPDEHRVAPPPDPAATRRELAELHRAAAGRDAARGRIAWWEAVAPAYRWNQIALEEAIRDGVGVNHATRRLALLHTALADAEIAAADSQRAHRRPSPAAQDPSLGAIAASPRFGSYPDAPSTAAAAAATVLAELFPARAQEFARQAEEVARLRVVAGAAFPSDVAAGRALGGRIGQAALARGRTDRSAEPWSGQVPSGPGYWNGTNPVVPQAANWRPWLLRTPDEFRPPPPPRHDSPERADELAMLRSFPRTPATNGRALFWEAGAGGLRVFEYWNNHARRLLLEYGKGQDGPLAARTLALVNVALYDVGIACWDAKYAFWTIRPSQLDPELRPVFAPPNHPSYPAAHACFSTASALVLAHLFPRDAASLRALAEEAGQSRIWSGIHYPSDVAVGQQLGARVASRVIARAQEDGGRM
jgi:membrane-associated phospholipid phosphatase